MLLSVFVFSFLTLSMPPPVAFPGVRTPPLPQLPVEVELLSPPPGQLYVEDLWRVRLTNTSTETFSVFLFVTIEESLQGLLMDATTSVFTLPPGTMYISSAELSPISTEFYDSGFEASVARMGGFPDGLYTVTIYVYEDGGGIIGQGGITQGVQNHSPPELLFPVDGEELTDPRPLFTWLPSIPQEGMEYSLTVVELVHGQVPQSAVNANPAWFLQEGVQEPQLAYPIVAEPFRTGATYAWQVEGFYQGVSTGASEVRTFTCSSAEAAGDDGTGVWSFETGDRVYCGPALAPDGSVICGSDDGYIYSLDGSGREQWRCAFGGPVYAVTVGARGNIYAAGASGMMCLDGSGFPLWRCSRTGTMECCPLELPSGLVVAGSSEGVFYCIDAVSGEVTDTLGTGGGIRLPAVADSSGRVYFAGDDGILRCVEVSGSGELATVWERRFEEPFSGGPVIFRGRLFAAAGRSVICLDGEGRTEWTGDLPSAVHTAPVISSSGVLYAGTGSGNVYALETEDGSRTGVVPAGAVVTSTPALTLTGAMVFGCEDGRLHCYSPSGFGLWWFPTGDQVRSSPTIGVDGTVYFGSDDHRIYAVRGTGAGPMEGGWPQYCLDSSNNGSLAVPEEER